MRYRIDWNVAYKQRAARQWQAVIDRRWRGEWEAWCRCSFDNTWQCQDKTV